MIFIKVLNGICNVRKINIFELPLHFNASKMFADVNIPACQAVGRNLMLKFIQRLDADKSLGCYRLKHP